MMTLWNREERPKVPRCGARRKQDGKPCQRLAMENGRCRLHGGLTPKGDDWHKPRWPDRNSPVAEQKLQRKLRDLERAAKKRAARLAAMTPEELERYKRWHQARKPGSAKRRAAAKREREAAASVRAMLAEMDAADAPDQDGRQPSVRPDIFD